MGYITLLGVNDNVTQYVTIENIKWMIIGTIKGGVQLAFNVA